MLGFEGRLETFEHHASHAASTFLYSGFPEAAVLTIGGVGEWATTTYGRGEGADLTLFEEVEFPAPSTCSARHTTGAGWTASTA